MATTHSIWTMKRLSQSLAPVMAMSVYRLARTSNLMPSSTAACTASATAPCIASCTPCSTAARVEVQSSKPDLDAGAGSSPSLRWARTRGGMRDTHAAGSAPGRGAALLAPPSAPARPPAWRH